MRREICAGKNEKGKSKKCKEHIFKLDFQGEISNKQPLISDCRKISGNIGTGIHTVTISVVCVYRKWVYRKSNRENTKGVWQLPSVERDVKRTAIEVQYYEDHFHEEHLSQKQLLEKWSVLNIALRCGINTK